jgi:hypothetical protein
MSIPRIRNINTVETYQIPNVQNVYIPRWMTTQPNVDYLLPPIVLQIGNPIVDIPGCVKAHKDNKQHKTGIPIDKDLVENDSKNAMTLCPDGSYPSYDAMNYEPEQLTITREQKAPPVAPPPEPDVTTPETPSIPPTEGPVDCPGPGQPRVGDLSQNGDEKVIGHELNENKTVCIVLYEDTNVVEKYLPPTNVVTTTASIAAVATASALFAKPLADILLRVVKPAIKQATAKIQKMLGKTPYRPSRSEVQSNLYREKKGLPPLKNAKGKYDFKGLKKATKKN